MTFPRPIGHWRLNGVIDDYSGNGHNGTWSNAGADAAYAEKDNGKIVADFDGSSDIDCGVFVTGLTVSICGRIKTTQATRFNLFDKLYAPSGTDYDFGSYYDPPTNNLTIFIGEGANFSNISVSIPTLNNGSEHFIGFSFNKTTGAINAYFDGENVHSTTVTPRVGTTNNHFMLGARYNHAFDKFNGWMDDVWLFNSVLTDAQVKSLYQMPELAYVPTQKTVAYNPDPSLILATNDGLRDNSKNDIAMTLTNCIPGNGKMVFTNGSMAFAAQTFTSYEYSYKASGSDRYIHYLFDGTNTYTNGIATGSMPVSISSTGFSGATGSMKDMRLNDTVKPANVAAKRYIKSRRFW